MDQEQNIINSNNQQVVKPKKSINIILILFISILMLIVGFGGGYFVFGGKSVAVNSSLEAKKIVDSITPTPGLLNVDNNKSQETKWRVAKRIAPVNFEYPNGWHVGQIWPEKWENGVSIWIDPEPVSTSPRGGPFATIEMNWKNGLQNAKEEFNKQKESFKNIDNSQEEIIESKLGELYHYTGVMPEGYLGGEEVDEYILFIDDKDNMNDSIISIGTIGKPELKESLRYMVLSFEKPTN